MTYSAPIAPAPTAGDPGRQIATLRSALALIESVAGRAAQDAPSAFDRSARIAAAYEDASPIVRRRFDARLAEIAIGAAAGVEALAGTAGVRARPAAEILGGELRRALDALDHLLGLTPEAKIRAIP